jgi:drug/metabolite transporter (DMT)-like permease
MKRREAAITINETPHQRGDLAIPALVVANIALACGPWLVRLARVDGGVGPIASGFWRLALALPVLLIATRYERRHGGGRAPRAMVALALLSGLFFAADLALWHAGILRTRLANATLLGNVTAILFPLYGFIAMRALPSRRQALALLLALAGAIVLFGRSYELSSRHLVGDMLCISAGLCYTSYLIAADRARPTMGPLTTLTWSVIGGVPVLLVAAIVAGDAIWPRDWTALILMSLGSQIVGQGLIMYAVARVAPLLVGLMLLIQPVVAALIGWVIYGEALTIVDLVGGVAIAGAVLLIRGSPRRRLPGEPKAVSSPA